MNKVQHNAPRKLNTNKLIILVAILFAGYLLVSHHQEHKQLTKLQAQIMQMSEHLDKQDKTAKENLDTVRGDMEGYNCDTTYWLDRVVFKLGIDSTAPVGAIGKE